MDHSPADIVAQYLIDEGVFIDPSSSGEWEIYVGMMPDGNNVEHDTAAAIDTAPVKDGRIMGGAPLFHPGVQIMVRASAYRDGFAKAQEAATALAAVDDDTVTIGTKTYQLMNITQATGVTSLGQEPGTKRRELFSVNFLATLKEV